MMFKLSACFFVILFTICASLPTDDESSHQNHRVHDNKLSDQDHFVDLDDDNELEHNDDYDHEAFLGKDQVEEFKQLTPEESSARLAEIIDKIDVNNDGGVTEEEMRDWIKRVSLRYIMKEVDSRWKQFEEQGTLEKYLEENFGSLNHWTEEEKELKKDEYTSYLKLMERDKRRFKAADVDGDGKLNKNEYTNFLHPEEASSMREIVIQETMEDIDKNGDGFVDINEYIADIYPDGESNHDEEEPDWVKNEREMFMEQRDKNNDGLLDKNEVANWILPDDSDHSLIEAKHLIAEADENKDGKLSKKEILDNYSIFVASQATAYGDAIHNREDL